MNSQSIDTRIGTASTYTFSHGNTLPLTGVPFGMNYLSVQTTLADTTWWFDPAQPTFAGIRLTHQASPWIGDFQHAAFMPLTVGTAAQAESMYRPTEASFRPDLIRLYDEAQQIQIEATNGRYGGALRLSTAAAPLRLRLVCPPRTTLEATRGQTAIVRLQNFAECEDPDFAMWLALALPTGTGDAQALASGDLEWPLNTQAATVRFATSFIGAEQAERNLAALGEADFDAMQAAHAAAWQAQLDRVAVTDHHAARVATFYHNLYRALLFPMRFYELDATGQPVHYDTTARAVKPGKLYTNNGFWDTYKTLFPFLSLMQPDTYHDMLEGFLTSYHEAGFLPRWLAPDERGMMPGTMVDAVIADAAVKGLADDLMPAFLTAMIHGAETISDDPKYGREGLAEYLALGYVPADIGESVNKTLDYAYSDWLISVVAAHLGETELQAKYAARSQNYRHLFDPAVKLMHPKDRNGAFTPDFNPTTWGNGFTEGSAWQNSFAVYQDWPGLIDLTGGKPAFIKHLHHLVNQAPSYQVGGYGQTIHEMRELAALDFGQLAISNQPSFHLPYLFTLAGDAPGTELTVKQLLLTAFNAGPAGYPGDEDNGSMSSWYLFSSLGFYPVTPGSGEYVLGIPFFDQVTLHLPNGRLLTLTTAKNHDHLQFVGAARSTANRPAPRSPTPPWPLAVRWLRGCSCCRTGDQHHDRLGLVNLTEIKVGL
ncbi:GH92 family glycosyl hydrolase [Lacticaseibacillus absianus]|uniref:GH92 family glycosyl hydrolase n=1 Tax=Lacticaseibacillus absianus TaxID=2729623 RepID=UPI001FE9FB17|nr:GH92 family glycosyl hydrolase [Lacticaseibacillus absianus]